jgi:mycothiol synthase
VATGAADELRVLEQGGEVVGYGDISVAEYVELDLAAPDRWGAFLDWAEASAREAGVGRVRTGCPAGHPLERVLAERGYRLWRVSLRMETELRERPDDALPAGFSVRSYEDADHDAVIDAMNDAFVDDALWRVVTPKVFAAYYLEDESYDPQLWSLAWDGDVLAGLVLAFPALQGDATLGWVRTLGVREPYRRRGLGGALLRRAFAQLHDRGVPRVGLGVDAENPTGALRLYERAGMAPTRRTHNYVRDV